MHKRGLLLAGLSALGLALTASPARAAGDKKPAAKGEARKLTAAESYLPIKGISAPLDANNLKAGALTVDLSLDIPDAALHGRMAKMTPRLRDALRTAVARYLLTHHRRGAAPDLAQLKRQLQAAADQTVGAPGVTVLLANVMVQI